MRSRTPSRAALPVAAVAVALLVASCAEPGDAGSGAADDAPSPSAEAAAPTETDSPAARLAVTYDGGVLVVDATEGEVLLDKPLEGFTRLNPAGDGRHLLLSSSGAFTALDLGAWTEAHGDHGHSFVTDPAMVDFTVAADEPGHVVVHHGRTTLFDDATGTITAFDPDDLADLAEEQPELDTWTTDEAHHGVAVQEGHGRLIHTVGDEDSRSGLRVIRPGGDVLAESDQCPGVHGEAYAGEVPAVGCEDGVLLVVGDGFAKAQSPDAYGRMGNLAGHDTSPVLLADYKTDPDAELERPTRVALVDSRDASVRLVDLGTSYTFRSLGRTPAGDALVLGTDGSLHVVDVTTGAVTTRVPVVAPWEEPEDWQQPRPALRVVDDVAYVTEPATSEVHVVDLESLAVTGSLSLPVVPNEIQAVTG